MNGSEKKTAMFFNCELNESQDISLLTGEWKLRFIYR